MLTVRLSIDLPSCSPACRAGPAAAQDFASHRAVYSVITLENGKPGDGRPAPMPTSFASPATAMS